MLTQEKVGELFDYNPETGNLVWRASHTNAIKAGDVAGWDKHRQKWIVQMDIDGRRRNLGRYSCFSEAVCVRLATEQYLGWGSCDNNTPARQYVKENLNGK
jgi:hypothetical protein